MSQKDDAKIIRRVLNGQTEDFRLLLERYGNKVYGLSMRLLGEEGEAEEVTQESFVQAFTHLSEYRGEADFGSWLYRIAYNTTLMHLRQRKAMPMTIDDSLADSVSDDDADAILAEVTVERIAALEDAVRHLSPAERTLVTMFYYDNRPTRDIAYVLDTTISNITTRLYRVRKKLYRYITHKSK